MIDKYRVNRAKRGAGALGEQLLQKRVIGIFSLLLKAETASLPLSSLQKQCKACKDRKRRYEVHLFILQSLYKKIGILTRKSLLSDVCLL